MMEYKKKRLWIPAAAAILLSLIIFSGQLRAEEPDEETGEELFEMSLEELMDIEVVSASRQPQKISELSAPVTIITAADIHHSGLTSIPEVLRLAPGVDVQRLDRNHYAVSIRGFQGSFSDRILVLINGRAAGNPVFAGINWESLPVLMEDIERIEVVRGPIGATWGANAVNGMINIITKKAVDTEGWFSSTTINEYGDSYTHTRFSQVSDLWSWRLSAGYEDLEDSDDAGAGRSSTSQPAVAALTGFNSYKARDFSRNWRFDFEARHQYSDNTELSFGAAHSNLEMGATDFLGFDPRKDYRTSYTRLFSRIDHEYDDGSTGYVQWFANNFVSHAPNMIKRYSYLENDIEAQYNMAPFAGHEISFGGNVRLTHITTRNGPHISETRFQRDHYNENWFGLFVTDRFAITDSLTIENQVRTDWYSETDFDWSLRSSALYSIDEAKDHMLRFSFARAFRSPAAALRETSASYVEAAPSYYLFNTIRPTKYLVNEESWSLEGGYTGLFDDDLSVNFNSYYQRYDNILGVDIQYAGAATNGTFYNGHGADAYGAELEVAVKNKKRRISAWYAYNALRTDKFEEYIRAAYPASHKAGLNTRLFLADDFVFNTNYTFYNSIFHYENISTGTPLSHRLDLTLSKQFADGKGEFMIGVSDVLNETSRPVHGISNFISHETPGRTLFARLQMKF